MGEKLAASGTTLPKIYTANWFRKGADGKFVWPGYGENMRVLKWIIDRIEGTGQGADNLIGVTPTYKDLTWTGLPFTEQQFDAVTSIDKAAWTQELVLHTELFKQLEHHLPKVLLDTKAAIERRLAA
jgi:phosphoenolpyruvate carboxykinase (GTP)